MTLYRYPLDVPCPVCGAKRGVQCFEWRERGYRVLLDSHAARYDPNDGRSKKRRDP